MRQVKKGIQSDYERIVEYMNSEWRGQLARYDLAGEFWVSGDCALADELYGYTKLAKELRHREVDAIARRFGLDGYEVENDILAYDRVHC